MRDLFRGYNKLIRPVQNMTQKVGVRFGLAFVQLINVVSVLLSKITTTKNTIKNITQTLTKYNTKKTISQVLANLIKTNFRSV